TMSDELAYFNLMAAKAGFKPIIADDSGDIELNSGFVADVLDHEGPEGEGGSKKRHNREDGERSPVSKKSKEDTSDPGKIAAGSTGVVSAQAPPPAFPVDVSQILGSFQGLTSSITSPADLTIAERSQRCLN
ncbi:hypothetical protein A2U01_0051093, partial [Trifolium medium]|nr:hypothetical protein [Trifolium medium]